MKEYVKGNGSYCVLAKKYGVPSKKQVHIWVTAYKKMGGRYNQGWGYQMKEYIHNLKENRIFQSMSRKGNCHDNSVMENFFGLLKQEIYYGVVYYSYDELKAEIERFITYYNEERIKEKLG